MTSTTYPQCESCGFGHPVSNPVDLYTLTVCVEGWGHEGDTVVLCASCATDPEAMPLLECAHLGEGV